MAGSFFALFDDIASILDDVAAMTKVATKKTAGVLGDDLALNAQQVAGVNADRELPVVWAVAKGSFRNKLILVPAALLISSLAPWAIIPLLMSGGAFLCFEGFEKLAHQFLHSQAEDKTHHNHLVEALSSSNIDILAYEKNKIQGAIRTDFILSAEIIVITLGTVAGAVFMKQFVVLAGIAIIMTIGVYGIVAGIVKLDDAGLHLTQKTGTSFFRGLQRSLGAGILLASPYLMRGLSVLGTAAMFMVGGSILTHGIPSLHHGVEHLAQSMINTPVIGGLAVMAIPVLLDTLIGIFAGAIVLGVVAAASKIWFKMKTNS